MSLTNVSINSQHGLERLFIRLTESQKKIINDFRGNKNFYIKKEDNEFILYENKARIRVLNYITIDKLLTQGFFEFIDPLSNKIILSKKAK